MGENLKLRKIAHYLHGWGFARTTTYKPKMQEILNRTLLIRMLLYKHCDTAFINVYTVKILKESDKWFYVCKKSLKMAERKMWNDSDN
jgi:hypothetical protein